MKQQAIWTNDGAGMNHDTVRVRKQEPARDIAREGNVRARDCRPEAVTKHRPSAGKAAHRSAGGVSLIAADRSK